MIPAWALRFAPYLVGLIVIVVACMGALENAKESGRAELKPQVERLEATLAAERVDRARAEKAADAYRSEMDALRSRPVPRTPVRLCVEKRIDVPTQFTPADRATRTTAPAGRYDETAGSNLEAGPDISADLYDLAGRCDAEIAKLRALQGWVNDVR